MATGIIGSLRLEKNFGFIEVLGESDCFFHRGSLDPDMEWDDRLMRQRVEFDIVRRLKT